MTGKSGVIAAMVVLLVGAAAPPATAEPAISCDYRVTSWRGAFSADLSIANSGPAIDGWTVHLSFPGPTTLLQTWRASMTQSSPFDLIATNLPWDGVISTGRMVTFGWTATAADTEVPAMSVNGTAC